MNSDTATDRDYTISAVWHALQILQTFLEDGRNEQSAAEISDRLGLNRSRVFRLLATLDSQDFVRQDPETKRYRLGLKLFELGQAVVGQFDLLRVVDPILQDLSHQAGETSYVYLLDGHEGVTIAKRECKQPMRLHSQVGRRDTLESGAACVLLLAHLPPQAVDEILRESPPVKRTARSLTDPVLLRERLAEIRALGYHLSRQEDQEGVDAVAAPIRDSNGRVIAALAVAGPSLRFTEVETQRIIRLVTKAAARISAEIGYLPTNNGRAAPLSMMPRAELERMAGL